MPAPVVVAEVVRSGFVEGHHHGSVVALAADGTPAWSVGDVTSPVLPRSCNKPLQALGMVRLGLDLPPELLALACASHSGEPFHLDGVRRILALGDLDVSALQTPPDYPLDDAAKVAAIRAGEEPSSLAMNCSGKHAAMLLTCVVNGWDTGDVPVARPPAPAGDRGDLRRADRRAGRRHRRRRLRCAAAVHLADRPGPRLPGSGGRDRGPGAPGRRGDPRAPGVRLRHDPRRAQAAQRGPRRDRQGRRRGVLRRSAPRRPGLRAQGRRRRRPGPPGGDGRGAAPQRRTCRGRRGRRRPRRHRSGAGARRRRAGGRDPGGVLSSASTAASGVFLDFKGNPARCDSSHTLSVCIC